MVILSLPSPLPVSPFHSNLGISSSFSPALGPSFQILPMAGLVKGWSLQNTDSRDFPGPVVDSVLPTQGSGVDPWLVN